MKQKNINESSTSSSAAVAMTAATHVPPSRDTKRLLHAGDALIALFVVGPLVVLHWRGTWALMARWPEVFTPERSAVWAIGLLCSIAMAREFLFEQWSRRPETTAENTRGERLARHVLRKVYTLVFGACCNAQWRGLWALLDEYFGVTISTATWEIVLCMPLLVLLASVRNTVAPPGVILTDSKDMSFRFPTRYRIKAADQPFLYIVDCVFSVLVIGALVVFVWRGVWILCDLVIYPDDFKLSSWTSLYIGYAIVAASFCAQSLMRWLCEQLTGLARLAVADLFLAFSFIGTVNVWRGVWNLCDIYFMPEHKLAGDIITHTVPFILLALLNCSNSVLVRGVYIDAEEPAGQCVIFPVYYVRNFFQKERTKKRKRQEAAAAAKMGSGAGAMSTLLPLLGSGTDLDMIKNNLKVVIVPAAATPASAPTVAQQQPAAPTTLDTVCHITETGGGKNNNDSE